MNIVKICPYCGKEVKGKKRICPHCKKTIF